MENGSMLTPISGGCCAAHTVEECQTMLAEAGVDVIRGPVARPGGRGRGTAPSLSLYARDPDDNLLEWMIYTRRREACNGDASPRAAL